MEARQLLEQARGTQTAIDQGYVQEVVKKWSQVLEGVEAPYQRACLGILLENELDHLKKLNEETLSTGVGAFTKYIFPILRRVFPNLIANQIVSVQPMSAPIGGIFTYEYKYDDTKGNATATNNLIQDFQKHYSSEYIDFETKVAAADVDGTKVIWSDGTNAVERIPFKWLPIRALKTIGTTVAGVDQYRVTLNWTSGGTAKQQVDDGAGGFTGDGTPGSSTIDYTEGTWEIDTTGDIPDASTPIYATYFYDSERIVGVQAPSAGVTGGTYASTDQVAKVPRASLDIKLTTVEAVSRKLGTDWSSEAVDDLRALHGMSAETELVAGISNEIGLELDREIIEDLVAGAAHSATYTFGPTFGGSPIHTELEAIRSLYTTMDAVGAAIHKFSKRAPANFVVVSPAVGSLLSQLTSHADLMAVNQAMQQVQAPTYGPLNSNYGVQRIGTLMNKYAMFQDPFLDDATILIGLKGRSFLDAGYVWAPYIPLQVTPTWMDPQDFRFRKGLRTRYAKRMLRPEYYGVVTVSGLPTVTTVLP